MHLSAVPPPLARTLFCHGHQAKAFTADWWSDNVYNGAVSERNSLGAWGQMLSKLSLPPLARYRPSGDHFKPQTSWNGQKIIYKRKKHRKFISNLSVIVEDAKQMLGHSDVVIMYDASSRAAGQNVRVPGQGADSRHVAGHRPQPAFGIDVPQLNLRIASAYS